MLLKHKGDVTEKLFEMTADWREERKKLKQEEDQQVQSQYLQREASSSRALGSFGPMQGTALQYNSRQEEMPVRSSPSASPNPAVLRSPVRLPGAPPPMGMFGVTSPDRLGAAAGTSPEKVGRGSPLIGSPSRVYPRA
jgi:hypothetical protein